MTKDMLMLAIKAGCETVSEASMWLRCRAIIRGEYD